MSRTRGSSRQFVADEGVLLGKGGVPLSPTGQALPGVPAAYDGRVPLDRQGNPIAPSAAALKPPLTMDGDYVVRGPGAQPVAPAAPIVGYRADRRSWTKTMDGWQLACLLDIALRNPGDLADGLVINLTAEEYAKLPGDLRVHFMAVRGE